MGPVTVPPRSVRHVGTARIGTLARPRLRRTGVRSVCRYPDEMTSTPVLPDYHGGSLANLVAELEQRLGSEPLAEPLAPELAALIPKGESYVLVLFDGLGDHQLDHPAVAPLARSRRAAIDAPFPTTTTVSLATIATGTSPAGHGLLGYQLWIPEVDRVVNTIRWTTLWGDSIDLDLQGFLPAPNLWERLSACGAEGFTVQPANFDRTALSRVLYRGAAFAGATDLNEWVGITASLAAKPNRLIFAYLPQVDFAAHVHGQEAPEYAAALGFVASAWQRLAERLPSGAIAVGTADHGHVDFPPERQHRISKPAHQGRTFYGDGRAMFVKGDGASLAEDLPARWIPRDEMTDWWGPGERTPAVADRVPDGVLLAEENALLLHRFSDDRMIGNHGGLTEAERKLPLLVAESDQAQVGGD